MKSNIPGNSTSAPETASSGQGQVEPDTSGNWIDPQLAGLVQSYPYMFAPPNLGLSMRVGWLQLFAQLCADIDALLGDDKCGFRWRQTKEKFGSARWYWVMVGKSDQIVDVVSDQEDLFITYATESKGEIQAAVRQLIDDATDKTEAMCIACGQNAMRKLHRGWLVVCCEEHLNLLERSPDEFARLMYPDSAE